MSYLFLKLVMIYCLIFFSLLLILREYKYSVGEKLILTEQLHLSIEFWRISGKSIKKPPTNIM